MFCLLGFYGFCSFLVVLGFVGFGFVWFCVFGVFLRGGVFVFVFFFLFGWFLFCFPRKGPCRILMLLYLQVKLWFAFAPPSLLNVCRVNKLCAKKHTAFTVLGGAIECI